MHDSTANEPRRRRLRAVIALLNGATLIHGQNRVQCVCDKHYREGCWPHLPRMIRCLKRHQPNDRTLRHTHRGLQPRPHIPLITRVQGKIRQRVEM